MICRLQYADLNTALIQFSVDGQALLVHWKQRLCTDYLVPQKTYANCPSLLDLYILFNRALHARGRTFAWHRLAWTAPFSQYRAGLLPGRMANGGFFVLLRQIFSWNYTLQCFSALDYAFSSGGWPASVLSKYTTAICITCFQCINTCTVKCEKLTQWSTFSAFH